MHKWLLPDTQYWVASLNKLENITSLLMLILDDG